MRSHSPTSTSFVAVVAGKMAATTETRTTRASPAQEVQVEVRSISRLPAISTSSPGDEWEQTEEEASVVTSAQVAVAVDPAE